MLYSIFQFWAAYVPCEAQHRDAVQLTLEQIDVIKRLTDRYSPQLTTCTSAQGKLTKISHIRRVGQLNSSSRQSTESIPGTAKMHARHSTVPTPFPLVFLFGFFCIFFVCAGYAGKLWLASLGLKLLKSILASYQKAVCRSRRRPLRAAFGAAAYRVPYFCTISFDTLLTHLVANRRGLV